MNWKLPDVQAGFRNGRGSRDQIADILWIIEKARELHKTYTSVSLTTLKTLTMWIITNCGKLLKKWEYQTILPASWETGMRVKKQKLEPCMEKPTHSGLRKEYNKAVYCHLVYLTCMQSTSYKMLGWNQDGWEKYQPPQIWKKAKRNLVVGEGGEWRSKLKTQIMASGPNTSWQRGKGGSNDRFPLLGI